MNIEDFVWDSYLETDAIADGVVCWNSCNSWCI